MIDKIKSEIKALRKKNKFAYLGSVSDEGFPQIKCMFNIKSDDMKIHYFSTNTSSKRVSQFRENPNSSVYYCNQTLFKGALFTGTLEVIEDNEIKAGFWNKGDEKYYPGGITDPDYCILKLTAKTVNYYHGLSNTTMTIEELCD